MISVLILTLNEEAELGDCLDSVRFSDDILVFDSGSSDRTAEIARARGARVQVRPFDDYGRQRESALRQGAFKWPWLLVLDADERVDPALAEELLAVAKGQDPAVGYRMRRKDHYLDGSWIPRATLYPTWHLRFFRHADAHYEPRVVHEHPMLSGQVGALKGHLLHYSFAKGMDFWVRKHRRYARMEAAEGLTTKRRRLDWRGLLSPDPRRRRCALKEVSYRMPFRAWTRFAYMMLFRWAFLDGWAGIQYSILISRYEGWIEEEMEALERGGVGP